MILARKKNGKEYLCDQCRKLIGKDETQFWNDTNVNKVFHFCTQKHKGIFILNRYNLPMFVSDCAQMTGDVIPVKNPRADK